MIPWSYSLLAKSPFKASEASQPPHVLASSVSRAAFVWLLATAPNREFARKLPWTKKQISSKTEEKIKKKSLRKHKERDLLLVNQSTSPRGYFLIWPIKDVPLDKVWFLTSQLRVYNFALSYTGHIISCESVLEGISARSIWFPEWLSYTKAMTITWICSVAIVNKWLWNKTACILCPE